MIIVTDAGGCDISFQFLVPFPGLFFSISQQAGDAAYNLLALLVGRPIC